MNNLCLRDPAFIQIIVVGVPPEGIPEILVGVPSEGIPEITTVSGSVE